MIQLTEERFQQLLTDHIDKLASKQDILDAIKPLATKEDVEELARMVAEGFNDIRERLDVRERLATVEKKLHKMEEALHLSL